MAANPPKYENPPPPSDNFDFNKMKLTRETRYYTEFGTECLFMHLISEELLKTPPDSEDDACYFLSSSEDEGEIISLVPSPEQVVVKAEPASPPRNKEICVKEEKKSDDERQPQTGKEPNLERQSIIELNEEVDPKKQKKPDAENRRKKNSDNEDNCIPKRKTVAEETRRKRNSSEVEEKYRRRKKSDEETDHRRRKKSDDEDDQRRRRRRKSSSPEEVHRRRKRSSSPEEVHRRRRRSSSPEDIYRRRKRSSSAEEAHRRRKRSSSPEVVYRRRKKSDDEDDYRRRRSRKLEDDDSNRRRKYSDDEDDYKRKIKLKTKSSSRSKKPVVLYSDSGSEEDYKETKYKPNIDTRRIKEEFPSEGKPLDDISAAFEEYICKVCNIVMNSQVTMQTHMMGKKHLKALKAQNIPEVAMQSLSLKHEPRTIQVPKVESKEEYLRYPPPPPGIRRIRKDEKSLIQNVVDEYRKGPIQGLSQVTEIRHYDKSEPTYYCRLCDSPCSPTSIMNHLIGYKHQLNCLERIRPDAYDRYRYLAKREIEKQVLRHLAEYELKYGRGIIVVEGETLEDPSAPELQPGPSWREDPEPIPGPSTAAESTEEILASAREDLDTSRNDFHCIVCDAHMNNQSMWEAHIRGKRHLKNKKKYPGESQSKVKAIPCPDARPHLEDRLSDVLEPVVGLDYIKETQGEMGDMYNCFLCGACNSEYDIVDHLLTTKHRVKFLETMNKKHKDCNGIEGIKALHDVSNYYKDSLIYEECNNMLERFGPGKVEVYQAKKQFGLI